MKKSVLKEYFSFTRKERIAVLVIAIIIIGIWLLPSVVDSKMPDLAVRDSSWVATAQKLIDKKDTVSSYYQKRYSSPYRSKQFYPHYDTSYRSFTQKKIRTISPIDINIADTSAFIALPGIGSKLALRIVNFRDKLGGFYSVEQVGEVYGIADSLFQKIRQYLKIENVSVKKININTASVDELKAHPYIRWELAKVIVAYRNEHGRFERIEDLKKIVVVSEEVYKKVAPYLSIE